MALRVHMVDSSLRALARRFQATHSPEDELGVAARTLPGVHAKGSFFTRGSGHNKLGGYTELPDEYQEVMDRLTRKHAAAKKCVPPPVFVLREGATFGVVTIGGCDLAVREAMHELEGRGVLGDMMRIRAFPFGEDVENFLRDHDLVFVVEQNRDAQLRSLLTLETSAPKAKLRSILRYGGFPLQAKQVIDGITALHTRKAPHHEAALAEQERE